MNVVFLGKIPTYPVSSLVDRECSSQNLQAIDWRDTNGYSLVAYIAHLGSAHFGLAYSPPAQCTAHSPNLQAHASSALAHFGWLIVAHSPSRAASRRPAQIAD